MQLYVIKGGQKREIWQKRASEIGIISKESLETSIASTFQVTNLKDRR